MTQSALSAGELTYLSTHPHRTRLYLAVLVPDSVFRARVNNSSIAQGDMDIVYDGVTEGEYGAIVAGMTLLVGSTAGAEDYGKVRIRSAEDGTIHVAENSDVEWTDDAYLTVVDNYEYWVKFSRAVESGGAVTHYQDYDGGFQGANQPPVPIMGPPACAFRGTSPATVDVDFVGEDSYLITGSSIDTYSWVFPNGTPSTANTVGTSASPHSVTWSECGVHWVSLEITDDDGQAATGRRPVFIFDRTGDNAPYVDFEITNWRGDWAAGGWQLGIRVFGDADADAFPEGAMVVLFAEEFWNGSQNEIGGYTGRENIKFVGYIESDSTRQAYSPQGQRYVEFRASTIHALMKDRENYPQTLQTCTTSTGWPYVTDLTVQKAAYHQIKWNSTLFDICDVYLPASTLSVASFDFPLSSLYRQIDDYLSSAVFAHACCDKQGALWLREDPQYLATSDRTGLVTVLDITDHQRDEIVIPHAHRGGTRHVELQGIYYHDNLSQPIISQAPGNAPRQDGSGVTLTGLVCSTQTATNALAGVVLAERNNLWTGISFKMAGNHSYLDIAQPAYIQHDLTAAGNKRGLSWTDELFVVRNIQIDYEPRSGLIEVDVTADRQNDPLSGVTGVYPVEPPEEDPADPDPPYWPPIPVDPDDVTGYMAAFDDTNGFYWRVSGSTSWTQRNTGLTSTAFLCGAVKRGWQTMQSTTNPESCILFGGGVGFLALTHNAGTLWTDITPDSTNITWVGDDPGVSGSITIKAVDCPNDATDVIYAFGDSACEHGQCAVLLQSDDLGVTWNATAITSAGGALEDGWMRPVVYVGSGGAGFTSGNCAGAPHNKSVANPQALISGEGVTVATFETTTTICTDDGWDIFTSNFYFTYDFGPVKLSGTKAQWPAGDGNVCNFYMHANLEPTSGFNDSFDSAKAFVGLYDASWNLVGIVNQHTGTPLTDGSWVWATEMKLNWAGIGNNNQWFAGLGAFTENRDVRYMHVYFQIGAADVHVGATLTLYDAKLKVQAYPEGWGSVEALGLAVDLEDASRIYVTYTDIGNGTWLATYDTTLAEVSTYDLTTGQGVTAARPRCVWQPTVTDYGDIVLLYGIDDAGGFVGYSDDAGVTMSDVSGELIAVNQVYALAATGDGAGQLAEYVAFGDGGEVYSAATLGTWTLDGAAGVTPDYRGKSISIGQDLDTTLLIGSGAAGATMIETSPSPFTEYTDITSDYPTDGANVMVEWIV